MIRGVFMNEIKDDLTDCQSIREKVFRDELGCDVRADDEDELIIHLLLFNEREMPVGTARLIFDFDGIFHFDSLAVLPEARKNGYGDFMMHMIFDKAKQSGAKYLLSDQIEHQPEYFKKYGFEIKDHQMILDLTHYFNTHQCCH